MIWQTPGKQPHAQIHWINCIWSGFGYKFTTASEDYFLRLLVEGTGAQRGWQWLIRHSSPTVMSPWLLLTPHHASDDIFIYPPWQKSTVTHSRQSESGLRVIYSLNVPKKYFIINYVKSAITHWLRWGPILKSTLCVKYILNAKTRFTPSALLQLQTQPCLSIRASTKSKLSVHHYKSLTMLT